LKCNKVEYCLTFPFKKLVFDVQIYFDCIIDDFLQNSLLSRDGDHVTWPLPIVRQATPQMKTMIQLKYLKKKKLDSWGEMRVNNLVQMNDCVNEPNIVYESGMRELGKKHCQIWHRRWV